MSAISSTTSTQLVKATAAPITTAVTTASEAQQKFQAGAESSKKIVQSIFTAKQINDAYNNCTFNFGAEKALANDTNASEIAPLLNTFVEAATKEKKHMVLVTVNSSHSMLIKQIQDCGFKFHNANPETAFLTKCLANHKVEDCTYPKFRTAIVGATMVVFNKTLSKVLLVREKFGQQNLKPPTGTVEYGAQGGTPSKTAAKELLEEVGIQVKPQDGQLVSVYWGDNFRPNVPDLNFAYAFKLSTDEAATKAQEDEISAIKWESTEEYIKPTSDKPWVMKMIVQAAKYAIENNRSWKETSCFYTTGKPVSLYSAM